MKKWKLLYCICFFGVCLCPFAGKLWKQEEVHTENRNLAELPAFKTEEGLNIDWLSQMGDYFQEHFAFRNELVTANALVRGRLLGVSAADGVIQGENGWLYYRDSLEDYLGTALLSERSLFNLAHTLKMTQENLEKAGVKFVFTVAPNKNSLYGENMPYYDSFVVTEENNLHRLRGYLEEEDVNYADLYEEFRNRPEILYHSRDSHWNNQGAALAGQVIMTALQKEQVSYEEEPFEIRKDFVGDLDEMLYPAALTPEDEIYYEKQFTYAYVGETESNFDPRIVTVNPAKSGNLVMYRDSFGNALLPFMADAYENAYFSRGVPYQLQNDVYTYRADTVVMERAERFLPDMAKNPPVLEGNSIVLSGEITEAASDGAANLQMKRQGELVQITGRVLPEYLDVESQIYLRINGENIYEAFPMNLELEEVYDGGFCLYLGADKMKEEDNEIEIIVKDMETWKSIAEKSIKEEMET